MDLDGVGAGLCIDGPCRLRLQMKPLGRAQQIRRIHMELFREPNFFQLPRVARNVPLGTSCFHAPPHPSRWSSTSCTQPCMALGPSFSALPSHGTEQNCHFATLEEVRAGGPRTQQQSRGGGRTKSSPFNGGGLFFFSPS